uniref:Uncharacterized protein n=1 Tax=Oryza sativa subsp. japonica TaxID=39947 RepID=Q6K640_ORYSJ|nr:hypothetical protein [Oryza sativa Japonica Group]
MVAPEKHGLKYCMSAYNNPKRELSHDVSIPDRCSGQGVRDQRRTEKVSIKDPIQRPQNPT